STSCRPAGHDDLGPSRVLDRIQRAARNFGRDLDAHCRRPAARSSSQSTTRPGSGSSAPFVAFGRSGGGAGEVGGTGTRSRCSTVRGLGGGEGGGGGGGGGAARGGGGGAAPALGLVGSGWASAGGDFVSCAGGAGRVGSARVTGSAVPGLVGSGSTTVGVCFVSCGGAVVSG